MKKKTIDRIGLTIILLLIIVPLLYMFLFPGHITGAVSGSHTGVVTAVEYNSNLIWESTLVYFKSDKASTQEDIYCVNDEAVSSKLKQAAKNNEQITISYENDFILWKWECNGGLSVIKNAD